MGETLPIARQVLRAGTWQEGTAAGTVRLDHHGRQRRRRRLVTEDGQAFLLDLAETMQLADGDALVLEHGTLIRVAAETESLLEIHTHDETTLLRIIWHLGNRHLPVEIVGARLRTIADHVIAQLVERLGGHVARVDAVFMPEAGAYASEGSARSRAAHDHHAVSHQEQQQKWHRHD
jgi:urease accessory protein